MIKDTSYRTVRHGLVRSYRGYEVHGEPGSRVLRIGYPPRGTAETLIRHGGIIEHHEAELGTQEFEEYVLNTQYIHGEITYEEYVQRLKVLSKTKE